MISGEGKAEEFDDLVHDHWIGHLVRAKLVATAKKYVRSIAPRGARLKYYFAEEGAANKMREEFAKYKELKYTVTVGFLPPSKPKR